MVAQPNLVHALLFSSALSITHLAVRTQCRGAETTRLRSATHHMSSRQRMQLRLLGGLFEEPLQGENRCHCQPHPRLSRTCTTERAFTLAPAPAPLLGRPVLHISPHLLCSGTPLFPLPFPLHPPDPTTAPAPTPSPFPTTSDLRPCSVGPPLPPPCSPPHHCCTPLYLL